jgi:ribokinase
VRVGVIGHVEMVEFAEVDHVPVPGEIVHAEETWVEAAGGGAVAAVQLARLAGRSTLFTALGEKEGLGDRAMGRLSALGVLCRVGWREAPQRRGWVYLDEHAERTITVIGDRHQPSEDDLLLWEDLQDFDAVYVTAASADVLWLARAAKVVVATTRLGPALVESGVELDAVVHSANDPGEAFPEMGIDPPPRYTVATEGGQGGAWLGADGSSGRFAAAELPGPPVDAYGCGDSFAAGLTFGLGAGLGITGALELAARCGASCLTGKGPYGNQYTLADDDPLRDRGRPAE